MLFALIVLVILQCLLLAGGVFIYAKARVFVAATQENITAFFSPQSEGQLSIAGQMLDSVSQSMAERIGVTTQAAIRGSLGGTMKSVNAALEAEAVQADPSLALTQALPKSLKKNPIALLGLQALMNKVISGQASTGIPSPSNGQVKFNL